MLAGLNRCHFDKILNSYFFSRCFFLLTTYGLYFGRENPSKKVTLMMKKVIAILFITAMIVVASGCETVKGVGKDVEKAGSAIKKSAS